jgi:ubiquitin-protein ligase
MLINIITKTWSPSQSIKTNIFLKILHYFSSVSHPNSLLNKEIMGEQNTFRIVP